MSSRHCRGALKKNDLVDKLLLQKWACVMFFHYTRLGRRYIRSFFFQNSLFFARLEIYLKESDLENLQMAPVA